MAFTVPSHLPRKTAVPDISTQILTKVSEATNKTLLSSLASSWVSELDESIQQTKVHALSGLELSTVSSNVF